MNKVILLVIGIVISLLSTAQDDWILKRDKDDIIIYTRERDESPLKEYRANAIINSPLIEVVNFLTDLEYRPEWVVKCSGLKIIDTLEGDIILYHTGYDIPWPLSDRDLVVEAKLNIDLKAGEAHFLTIHSLFDYPLEKGLVRMAQYREEVFLEEVNPGQTEFRAEGFADPGGSVPAWLVNMFLVDGIYDSVIRTREEVLKRNEQAKGND